MIIFINSKEKLVLMIPLQIHFKINHIQVYYTRIHNKVNL